jgi:PAS domain S-box-containing protein
MARLDSVRGTLATEYRRSDDRHDFAACEVFQESERLLAIFSRASAIGFAILDKQLRYQAINNSLAAINGIPAEAHLGRTVREVFGELSEKAAEPNYHRVLAHGEVSHFEVTNAVLPTRADSRYWGLNTNFPIRDRAGRVKQIGMMVVEVTEQRKLEMLFFKLAAELRHAKTRETFWLARELKDSIDQYHAALAVNLEVLVRQPKTSTERLTQSVELVDQRIVAMRELVSEVASRFPIDQQF